MTLSNHRDVPPVGQARTARTFASGPSTSLKAIGGYIFRLALAEQILWFGLAISPVGIVLPPEATLAQSPRRSPTTSRTPEKSDDATELEKAVNSSLAREAIEEFKRQLARHSKIYQQEQEKYREETERSYQESLATLRDQYEKRYNDNRRSLIGQLRAIAEEVSKEGLEGAEELLAIKNVVDYYEKLRPNPIEPSSTTSHSTSSDDTEWFELLHAVDVNHHAVAGTWTRNGAEITTLASLDSRITIPSFLDGSYELSLEFTRTVGMNAISVVLPVGNSSCLLMLSGWNGKAAGLWELDKQLLTNPPENRQRAVDFPIFNGRRYRWDIQVSIDGETATIESQLNRKVFLSWHGKTTSLSLPSPWHMPNQNAIGIGANHSVLTFHRVAIRLRDSSRPISELRASDRRHERVRSKASTHPAVEYVLKWSYHYPEIIILFSNGTTYTHRGYGTWRLLDSRTFELVLGKEPHNHLTLTFPPKSRELRTPGHDGKEMHFVLDFGNL